MGDGWYILIFYCLAGLNWSVLGTAFAAYNSQTFIGQVIFYFLAVGGSNTVELKEICIVIFAALIMPAVYIADSMKPEDDPAMAGQENSEKGSDSSEDPEMPL